MALFWKNLPRAKSFTKPTTFHKKQSPAFQPALEQLEDKVLMSMFTPMYMSQPIQGNIMAPANGRVLKLGGR